MRLAALILAAALVGGVAHARAKPPKADDQRVCVTTTTVVRRGELVLSSSSTTRCEDEPAAAAPPAAASAAPQPSAGVETPAPSAFGEGSSALAKLVFGSPASGLKPRDVLGLWTVLVTGADNACTLRLTREVSDGGYRAFAIGCRGALGRTKAWKFEDTFAGLYAADGAQLARLVGDRQHLSGVLTDGREISLSR